MPKGAEAQKKLKKIIDGRPLETSGLSEVAWRMLLLFVVYYYCKHKTQIADALYTKNKNTVITINTLTLF